MNNAKIKRDLSTVAASVNVGNGQQRTIVGQEAIRALYPMKTKGASMRDKNLFNRVVYLAAGSAQVDVFAVGLNSAGITLYDTNLKDGGTISDKKDFFLEGFDILPLATAATEANRLLDLNALLNYGHLVLEDEEGTEVFSDGPLRTFVKDRALIGVDATQGNSVKSEPYMLRNPINMEARQKFAMKLIFKGTPPVLTADVKLNVRMLGQEHQPAMKN